MKTALKAHHSAAQYHHRKFAKAGYTNFLLQDNYTPKGIAHLGTNLDSSTGSIHKDCWNS